MACSLDNVTSGGEQTHVHAACPLPSGSIAVRPVRRRPAEGLKVEANAHTRSCLHRLVPWPPHCGGQAHARHVPHAVRERSRWGRRVSHDSGLAVAPQKQRLTFPWETSASGGSWAGLCSWDRARRSTPGAGPFRGSCWRLTSDLVLGPRDHLASLQREPNGGAREVADRTGRGRNRSKMERGGGGEGREICPYDQCKFQVSELHYHLAVIIAKLIACQ